MKRNQINQRNLVIGGALLLTLSASAWLHFNEENDLDSNVTIAKKPVRAAPSPITDESNTESHTPMRVTISDEAEDIFFGQPPPPPDTSANDEPVVPDLPFAYAGKLIEDGVVAVFLSTGSKDYVVKKGDVLEQDYRVDEIKPPQMQFTYLPMNAIQHLNIGEVN